MAVAFSTNPSSATSLDDTKLRQRVYRREKQKGPDSTGDGEDRDSKINDFAFQNLENQSLGSQVFIGLTDQDEKSKNEGKNYSRTSCCCCKKNDKNGETSPKEKIFKSNEVVDTQYPKIFRILEWKFLDVLFVISCLASIFLFTFCEGFLTQSRMLWGLIHLVNTIYIMLLLLQWVQVILKAKYNRSHSSINIIFSLLSVLPADLIVLLVKSFNNDKSPHEVTEEDNFMFTISRLHYIFRIKNILNYLSNWENQLILGDFYSFLLRVLLYTTLLVHTFACIWHRIACKSFRAKHFIMDPFRAREDICQPGSWIMKLSERANAENNATLTPFLGGSQSPYAILWEHYAVSLYWSICTSFHVGFGDVQINVISMYEVIFTALVQIASWIFVLAVIIGTLTSLLIESDTERESFLTRRFAIGHYLKFSKVGKTVVHEVQKFYDYLWTKRKGVSELMLIEVMPPSMKSEIFFDIHKFVLEQMPLFQDLEPSFLMTLSVRMTHSFHLTGETLFQRHDRGDHMFYVLKGHLDIMSADESHPIACIRSGSAVGDIFLVHPYIHCCTVRCGSECDILALTRASVTEVLKDYPQYVDILQTRIQDRFVNSVLLLSLAAKYDEAPQLFSKLPFEMPLPDIVETPLSVNEEEQNPEASKNRNYTGSDADGLSLTSSVMEKMSTMYLTAAQKKDKKLEKKLKNSLEEAYAAFAADVNRTCLLAKDLGIGRPPLLISSPSAVVASKNNNKPESKTNVLPTGDGENIVTKFLNEEASSVLLCWKLFVCLCILLAMFYYPYKIGFRSQQAYFNLQLDGVMHLVDVIFFIDFCFDMRQIVVTPQKTLESISDILSYRAKTLLFYIRILAFLPLEYIFGGLLNLEIGKSAYFYMFKCNRYCQLIVLAQFFQDLEGVTKIPMMPVYMIKYFLILFYVVHIFAILYQYIQRDWLPNVMNVYPTHLTQQVGPHEHYVFFLYWATQVVTTAGFGDILYCYNEEIFLFCCAFVTGTVVTTYLNSKLAAMLANAQRRRITFKQTYYGVTTFLKQRKFSEDLSRRIKAYYQMQWSAHEGVLIPKEKSAIYDSPEAIIEEVSLSQGLKFISRVPILRHTSEAVLKSMCRALKQYFVPPDECVQFEGDKRRELYIIVNGFCKVSRGKEFIGYLTEGNYFGLNGLVAGINREYRITTETHCLFFCLQFDDFIEISKSFKLLRKDYMVLRGEAKLDDLKRVIEADAILRKQEDINQNVSLKRSISESERTIVNAFDSVSSIKFLNADNITYRQKNLWFVRLFLLRRTFLPSGLFMTLWISFRISVGAFASFYVLMCLAFAMDPYKAFITVLVFDIIAWTDMYLMLHVSYYNEANQLITDPLKTAKNYLCGPFILDLLFSFPFDWIAIVAHPEIKVLSKKNMYFGYYRLISLLRINRAFQPYKLIQMGIKLNQTIFKSLSVITFIEVMPWMLLSIHIMACISVLSVCEVSVNGDRFNCSDDAWLTHGSIYQGIKNEGPRLDEPLKMYVTAFYWTIVVALRVGFGDIDVINRRNRMICVIVIVLGCLISAYISSKLTACMVGEDSRRIEIRTKIDIMYSFLDRFKASRAVKRRVKEIYFNEWDKTRGISVDTLFVALHPSLKADVLCHLYEDSIRQSPLLKDLDEPGIRMLSSVLREVFIVEGEFIFKYGNITDDLFLISSGIVAAYNAQGDVMSYMGSGSLIGEMSALYGITRLYSAVAATDIHMLVFSAEDFNDFLELYPDLKGALEQLCENMSQAHRIEPTVSTMNTDLAEVLDPGSSIPFESVLNDNRKSRSRKGKFDDETDSFKDEVEEIIFDASQELATSRFGISNDDAMGNQLCVLDPLRVPLKSGQLMDKEKELMLQEGHSGPAMKEWWSVFVTFGRVPKTEIGALLHIYQDQKRCNLLNFTIHPASPMVRGSGWSVFNLLVTAISCGLTAYEISFTSTDESESWPIIITRYSAELFFAVRIMGNFHLGYVDDSGNLITEVKIISKRYVTSIDGFVLDIATSIPFYSIAYIIGGPRQDIYAANIRGIQLLRVILFLRYLSETGTDLQMKASEVKILKITILLCFIFHFCACAWYLVACYGMLCSADSWMEVLLHKLRISGSLQKGEVITIGSRYWISLAYVTTTITATGLNDVTPRTTIELATTIFFIFGTVFILGFLLGEMTQCLASQISRKIHYEHELSVIESHLAGLGLNKAKRESVSEYYKLVWRRFKGLPYYSLLQELPYPLRSDISYEIYGPNIRMSRVLGKVGEQIIRQITARIQHEFYLPGGYIVRGGSVCDCMYFIKRGEVAIIDENMGIELVVETLRENDCFGEMKILLPREPFRFSYVARQETELGMLKREDLDEVFRNFPRLRNESIDTAKNIKTRQTGGLKGQTRKEMMSPNLDLEPNNNDSVDVKNKGNVKFIDGQGQGQLTSSEEKHQNHSSNNTHSTRMVPKEMKKASIAKIETIHPAAVPSQIHFEQQQRQQQQSQLKHQQNPRQQQLTNDTSLPLITEGAASYANIPIQNTAANEVGQVNSTAVAPKRVQSYYYTPDALARKMQKQQTQSPGISVEKDPRNPKNSLDTGTGLQPVPGSIFEVLTKSSTDQGQVQSLAASPMPMQQLPNASTNQPNLGLSLLAPIVTSTVDKDKQTKGQPSTKTKLKSNNKQTFQTIPAIRPPSSRPPGPNKK